MTAEVFHAQTMASESTKVEAERAKAEVVAKVMAAKSMPRHEAECRRKIMEMCQERAWAIGVGDNGGTIAFYKFRRGKETVSDMTIHVATEMARIWGNIEYGIVELARGEGQSEMRAFAWDQQTNATAISNFIVPHTRDTQSGKKTLVDDRDIYENNANQGARRVREMIFRLIPRYIRDEARDTLLHTMAKGDGTPLSERRRKLADAFLGIGVTEAMIAEHAGRAVSDLTEQDVADLRVTFQSIKGGDLTIKEAFGIGAQPTGALAAAVAEKQAAPPKATSANDARVGDAEPQADLLGKDDPDERWKIGPNERVIDGLERVLKEAGEPSDCAAIQEANKARIAKESSSNQKVAATMIKTRAQELSG